MANYVVWYADRHTKEVLDLHKAQPKLNATEIAELICKRHKIKSSITPLRKTTAKIIAEYKSTLDTKAHDKMQFKGEAVESNKKVAVTSWREWIPNLVDRKELRSKASGSQLDSQIKIKTKHDKVIIQPISDTHFGALGVDYEFLAEFTDLVLNTPNLYMAFIGDMTDNFVNFKNVSAMHAQLMNPEEQLNFFESWLNEVKHKVLFATWCNHSEFEERNTGFNSIKRLLERNVIYQNGIGMCNLKLNDVEYKIISTHKTRYYSSFNLLHGLKQMARKDFQGGDIYIAGDKHEPDFSKSPISGKFVSFLQLGTLKVKDTFSQRYFSRFTHSEMPCVVLDTKTFAHTPFLTLQEAIDYSR